MLRISKPLNAGKLQNYHQLEYTSPSQSYYQQGDTIKGEWQGELAKKWELSGAVTPEEFTRLSEGLHPTTGDALVRHRVEMEYKREDGSSVKSVEHRAGWDATFSAPKSVSLTALVGGDERIREAHREAVTTALMELEKYTQARLGGNRPAETSGRFIVAKFEHDTARPVDGYAAPQLHTHAVIFNVTERADGTTRAIDADSLFVSQQYATAIYQSELMYKLRSLGYEIERGRSGAPEIKSYSADYLDISSQRHQQIEEVLAKRGASGHEAAEIAAHATREKKQELTPAQVLAAHRDIAEKYGNQPQRIVAEARERSQQQQHSPDRTARAKEAITYARSSLYEREAVADERLIFRDALRRGMGETTYAEVRQEFESRRKEGDFRSVEPEKYASGRSFTTPETIAAEHANVAFMRAGQNTVQPIMTAEAAQKHAHRHDFLNQSQRRVVEEVLNSPDRVHGLQGRAGVGKTTVLRIVREGAEKSGYTVEGFAPTSRAAGQLREAGIEATTLQSFLARRADTPDNKPVKQLYMLDEASLTSTRQMRDFLEKLKPEDRVLIIGDTRQHQGVDAGRPFQQLQDAGMRTALLDRIMRQKDAQLLKAVEHFSRNETQLGIELLKEQGRVTQVANRGERIAAIAKSYAESPEGALVVSADNKSRQEINEAVRSALREKGVLPAESRMLQTLAHRSDMTGADRTWAARYNVGDVVQYNTGSKDMGLERNIMATVRSVDAPGNMLTVERPDGVMVFYDPRRLRGVNVFREEEREFSVGDRLQFTAPDKKLGIANRDIGTVTEMKDASMTVKMDGKGDRSVTFDTVSFRQYDHGYAVTSHSSQGLTTTRVLAHFDTEGPRGLINTRLAYVAISRATHDAHIYTNDAEALSKRLAVDVSKSAAVDFRSRDPDREVEKAVDALRAGDTDKDIEILKQQGRVHEYAASEHRLAAIAIDYAANPKNTVVVVADPGERRELTALIRDELRQRGVLQTEQHSIAVLVEQDFGTGRLAARYAPGDRISYRTGSQELGIADGSEAPVVRVDAKTNTLTVATRDGSEVSYNPALTRKMTAQSSIYREEDRDITIGERIRFTASGDGVKAGAFGSVERVDEEKTLTVRLDNGKSVQVPPDQTRNLDYGYTVESINQARTSRVLVANDLTQKEGMEKLTSHVRDLSIYNAPTIELSSASMGKSQDLSTQSIELESVGIGR